MLGAFDSSGYHVKTESMVACRSGDEFGDSVFITLVCFNKTGIQRMIKLFDSKVCRWAMYKGVRV